MAAANTPNGMPARAGVVFHQGEFVPASSVAATKRDSTVALLCGTPKKGKTLDAIYAFYNAVFIAAEGALKAALSVARLTIPPERIRTATTVAGAVIEATKIAEAGKGGRMPYPALVIDDLTLIVDNSVRDYEHRNVTKWALWRCLRNDLLDLRKIARQAGLHVIFTCHETEPRYEEIVLAGGGKQRTLVSPGGINLPGQMKQGLPAICDVVLRAEPGAQFVTLWPVVYRNMALNPEWVGIGVRELPPIDPLPMNLGEILRAAGHNVPEPFAGYDGLTGKLATILAANAKDAKKIILGADGKTGGAFDRVLERVRALGFEGLEAAARANWVIRDALARAQLRKSIEDYFARPQLFGSGGTEDIVL